MHCPDCRRQIRSFEEYCPRCGADLNQIKLAGNKKKISFFFLTF